MSAAVEDPRGDGGGELTVSESLRAGSDGEENEETVTVALGFEERAEALLLDDLALDRALDLAELEENERVVLLAVGVLLREDLKSLLTLALRDQVTWSGARRTSAIG